MRQIKFRAWDEDSKSFVRSDDIGMLAFCQWADSFADIEFQQYTGLKDKNGVEIYEGDIVKSRDTGVVIPVEWSDGNNSTAGWAVNVLAPWVVVGNIYENPELLGANQ